jgi:hypothetical protein
MIIRQNLADRIVRETFGIGVKPEDAPIPSQDEKRVRMPKTMPELQKYLKRFKGKV